MTQLSKHPVGREHNDFPVSFTDFAARLKGTSDEVWTKWLGSKYKTSKMTFGEWRSTLVEVKGQ